MMRWKEFYLFKKVVMEIYKGENGKIVPKLTCLGKVKLKKGKGYVSLRTVHGERMTGTIHNRIP
jgi:hypothetical protein